jgi:hypothetical protein
LAFSLNFFASPLFAIVEGCGRIADLARMRIGQNIVANIALWVTLLLHGGLFAASLFQTAMVGYGLFWIASSYWRLFLSLFRTDITDVRFSWREEVWPFQWRIAISWVSGYFMFQLFNPILFATHGAVVAGQMGMSLNLCSSLMGLSIAWMSTKASPFGVLVAKRRWKELDEQFFRTLGHSLLVLVSGLGVLYVVVLFLNRSANPYAQRVLPPTPFACLIVATAMNHVLFCEAQYLRAHKAEPFLYLSVAAGVFTCLSVYLLAKPFSAAGVSIGYLVSSGVTLCWGTLILRRLRRVWHVESADEAICPV